MKLVNKVIVLARLSDGDTITVSTKAEQKSLSVKNLNELKKRMTSEFSSCLDDIIYFTVRTTIDEKKDNWKLYNLDEVNKLVEGIICPNS